MEKIKKEVDEKKEKCFDKTQEVFKEYYRRYQNKVKDPFYNAFLKTQLFSIYFHDI